MVNLRIDRRDAAWVASACAGAVVLGILTTTLLTDREAIGVGLLALVGGLSLVAFFSKWDTLKLIGPGVTIAAVALSGAFLFGLFGGDFRTIPERDLVILLFGISLACLIGGAVLRAALSSFPVRRWPTAASPDPFTRLVFLVAAAAVAGAFFNLFTGTIPLFAENVDDARFTAEGGALSSVFVFIIGAVQWVGILVGVTWVVRGERPDRLRMLLLVAAMAALVLIAARSLILTVPMTILIAAATIGNVRGWRLALFSALALLLLAGAGQLRVANSDPTGERRAFLAANGYEGPLGLIVQSASTGPWVFGNTIDRVPSGLPYQNGNFFLADFRSQFPGNFLGDPQRSDQWVTEEILDRDSEVIGGSPPTLVGGFYIDGGIAGIVLGSLLLGALLALLYAWAAGAGTVGALVFYAYAVGWVALSAYSYLSLKPLVLTALVLSYATHLVERRLSLLRDARTETVVTEPPQALAARPTAG